MHSAVWGLAPVSTGSEGQARAERTELLERGTGGDVGEGGSGWLEASDAQEESPVSFQGPAGVWLERAGHEGSGGGFLAEDSFQASQGGLGIPVGWTRPPPLPSSVGQGP